MSGPKIEEHIVTVTDQQMEMIVEFQKFARKKLNGILKVGILDISRLITTFNFCLLCFLGWSSSWDLLW